MKKLIKTYGWFCCLIMITALVLLTNGCGGGGGGGGGGFSGGGGGSSGNNGASLPNTTTSLPNVKSAVLSSPTSGSECTINGYGFGVTKSTKDNNRSYVSFVNPETSVSADAVYYSYWSDTVIKCIIPTIETGRNYVVVVNIVSGSGSLISSSSTSSSSNTINVEKIINSPSIAGINPAIVTAGQGSAITITGSNFESAQLSGSYIGFTLGNNTVLQTGAAIWNNSQIVCNVPVSVGSGTASVYVHTESGGNSGVSSLTVNSSSGNAPSGGKVYALFIGINAYPTSPLNYCVSDANGMKNSLVSGSIWSGAFIETLIDSGATKSNIISKIASISKQVADADTFLFYYSGHGSNLSGHAYIVPVDNNGTASSCIRDDELYSYMSAINRNAKKVIMFDSCNSGGFIGKENELTVKFLPISGSDVIYKGESIGKQLENLANTVSLMACKGSQLSYESSGIQHGVFTYYLMQGLGNASSIGPADSDGSGSISADELFVYSLPLTQSYAFQLTQGVSQDPQESNNYGGDLLIKN